MDAARWKKQVAQLQEVIDLLVTLPEAHPIIDQWRDRLNELMAKVRRGRKPLGKRDGATVDNIEHLLRSLVRVSRLPDDGEIEWTTKKSP